MDKGLINNHPARLALVGNAGDYWQLLLPGERPTAIVTGVFSPKQSLRSWRFRAVKKLSYHRQSRGVYR